MIPGPLENLPEEILAHIFSFLTPKELLDKVDLINHFFHQFAQDPMLWKQAILRYFPYLANPKNEEYKNNPKKLFIKTLHTIAQEPKYESIDKKLILAALCGESDKIKSSTLSETQKEDLYALSAANGHMAAPRGLCCRRRGLALIKASQRAKINNYSPAQLFKQKNSFVAHLVKCKLSGMLNTFLTEIGKNEDNTNLIVSALMQAACQGRHEIVTSLLLNFNTKMSLRDKKNAFYTATQHGRTEVLRRLIIDIEDQLNSDDKKEALLAATQNGHFLVVKLLLEEFGDQINAYYKEDALLLAILKRHIEIAGLLLKQIGDQMSSSDTIVAAFRNLIAFRDAAQAHYFDIAEKLLPYIRDKLIADDLMAIYCFHLQNYPGWHGNLISLLSKSAVEMNNDEQGKFLCKIVSNEVEGLSPDMYKNIDWDQQLTEAILTQVGNKISTHDKSMALSTACEMGRMEIVQTIVTHPNSGIDIEREFLTAVRNNQVRVAQCLLSLANDKISVACKRKVLILTAYCGYGDILYATLMDDEFSLQDIEAAKAKAVSKGNKQENEYLEEYIHSHFLLETESQSFLSGAFNQVTRSIGAICSGLFNMGKRKRDGEPENPHEQADNVACSESDEKQPIQKRRRLNMSANNSVEPMNCDEEEIDIKIEENNASDQEETVKEKVIDSTSTVEEEENHATKRRRMH